MQPGNHAHTLSTLCNKRWWPENINKHLFDEQIIVIIRLIIMQHD